MPDESYLGTQQLGQAGCSEGEGFGPPAPRDEAEALRILVSQSARFSTGFLRWMEDQTCDGLSYQQLRLMDALQCGGPAIMRDLGTRLGVTPRNMTAIVDSLEEANLVVRRAHPTDRRATLVALAPGGARAEHALSPRLDMMAQIFSGLTAAEREQFSALLVKLTRAMRAGRPGC
jgi:DNA-binding MarR family transcriptional regulator